MSETHEIDDQNDAFADAIFLTGATASGKTALGVEIARAINADVVSMDSMAIYRRMDVGVATPTREERAEIAHHMIDLVEPTQEYSTADYLRDAANAVRDARAQGKRALFVGGTPLYLKAILFGVFDSPAPDPELRRQLREMEDAAPGALHRELARVDPVAAARLHPHDVKRVARALEVFRLSGAPISQLQNQFSGSPRVDPRRVFILTRDRAALYERINARVDEMMRAGFLEETRALTESNALGPTARQALGYRELASALSGETTLESAVELLKQRTRNFAKRQETWFRSLEKIGARRIVADGRSLADLRAEICGIVEAESL